MKTQVSRIEGVFRSTCEMVMSVLRDHKDSLMAMLEAFVHDPLISWRLLAQPRMSASPLVSFMSPRVLVLYDIKNKKPLARARFLILTKGVFNSKNFSITPLEVLYPDKKPRYWPRLGFLR